MSKIAPCLWYANEAEEAARLYVSLLPDSRIDKVHPSPADTPGPKEGEVLMVEFTLAGQAFLGLNGGEPGQYTQAMSLQIETQDQVETDKVWAGLLSGGGREQQCGWLNDRWGVNWQVTPKRLKQLVADPDPGRSRRAMQAMFKMVKIDIAALEAAAGA